MECAVAELDFISLAALDQIEDMPAQGDQIGEAGKKKPRIQAGRTRDSWPQGGLKARPVTATAV